MRLPFPPLTAALAASTLLLAGCATSDVRLSPAGRTVRAAYVNSVAGCLQVGTATVSVNDSIGPFARGNLSVRDNLEVLARNAGAGLGANTVKPLAPPVGGQQQWGAYRCPPGPLPRAAGGTGVPASAPAPAASTPQSYAPAQTAPLRTEPLQVEPPQPVNPATGSSVAPPTPASGGGNA